MFIIYAHKRNRHNEIPKTQSMNWTIGEDCCFCCANNITDLYYRHGM